MRPSLLPPTYLMPRSRTCSGSAMRLPILTALKSSAGCHPIRDYLFRDLTAPSDIDDQLSKMRLLGHMRERLKSLVECKFAIHYRGESLLLNEPIHVFEMLA